MTRAIAMAAALGLLVAGCSGTLPVDRQVFLPDPPRQAEAQPAVFQLPDNVKEFGEHWRTMFPLEELFEEVVDSSHVGVRKPEREIYALTCSRMAIEPTEAVFVDDNALNVMAARDFGMEAVHFREDPWVAIAELDEILERRGVTTR